MFFQDKFPHKQLLKRAHQNSIAGFRNPIPAIATTLGPSTAGSKRQRHEESSTRPTKVARTAGSGPSKLGCRVDSGMTVGPSVSLLGAANLNTQTPTDRPFAFKTFAASELLNDSVCTTSIPPIDPLLLPPKDAHGMPTGLDSSPIPFRKLYAGLIVTVPWPETAMTPEANPCKNREFVHTRSGIVCAKRRMVIILWVTEQLTFLAVPISSHGNKGLSKVGKFQKKFHICLQDWDDDLFRNENPVQEPLIVTKLDSGRMGRLSSVDLSASSTIKYGVDVRPVGYLSRHSTAKLRREYKQVQNISEQETSLA